MEGAPLLYNLMLAEKAAQQERIDRYRQALVDWAETVHERGDAFARWDWPGEFWRSTRQGNLNLKRSAITFVEDWLQIALDDPERISGNTAARELIHNRERRLKGSLARLDNPRALELWTGAAGVGRLNYRWPIAQTLLGDILQAKEDA